MITFDFYNKRTGRMETTSLPDKTGEYKELNRFSVDYDDSVTIDFNMLLRAFDVLYPINKLVEFKIF